MELDSGLGNAQLIADLAVRQTFDDAGEHFALPGGQGIVTPPQPGRLLLPAASLAVALDGVPFLPAWK